MTRNASALASRYEGRLCSEAGCLYLVVGVDVEAGIARVSCRLDGRQQVIEMPIAEVGLRLAASANLSLDGLDSADTRNRITHRSDGWYFSTREGPKGPYRSKSDADISLRTYILSAQSDPASRSERAPIAAG